MHRALVRLVCVLLLSLVPLGTALAQTTILRGHVADSTGTTLARADVSIDGTNLHTLSGDRGEFELRGVPAGTRTWRARMLGYVPASGSVEIAGGATVTVTITLAARAVAISAIDVVVGSRAHHAAADELAVPVDVFTADVLARQGSNETSQILQSVSPSVNFPRQSVTDASDIARPFTLRGLSPDHTLVLVNGWRRHQMAVVNTFAYGMPAGSSGVDMNAIPSSAIDRIEVLRDGASAQYGSDAIAGVVSIVTREGAFAPFLNADAGQYRSSGYGTDGTTLDLSGGAGFGLGRGSLALFAEYLDRDPTNRAGVDVYDDPAVPQPNHHWGDGLERDIMGLANLRVPVNAAGTSEVFATGSFATREGTGNGYRRYASSARNWPEIYSLGFLPEFRPNVTDYSMLGGLRSAVGAWSVELGASWGHNDFEYNLRNTLNTSLGPSLGTATAPGDDGILGTSDDPGITNQTSFFAGRLSRDDLSTGINLSRTLNLGLVRPASLALGAAFRREAFRIEQGERASWIDGGHLAQDSSDASAGSQVFPGFAPSDEVDANRTNIGVYADLEADLSRQLLASVAGRFENYSDFGSQLTGKLALRFQPSRRVTLRAAGSTGFRAPGLGQSHFSKVVTNVIAGTTEEIGVFPVDHPAALALGSKPLQEETSVNLSAGVVVSPTDNITLAADYFRIAIADRIILGATFDDDTTLAILAANGFTDIAGVQYFTNGLDTRTEGVDLAANFRFNLQSGSHLDLTAAANYTQNVITRVDPIPTVLQNSAETGLLDTVTTLAIEEERPDWRATITAQYTAARLHALVRGSYYGGFSSAQPGYCDNCRDSYGAKTLFDAEIGYRIGSFDIALGARNLLDTYPDSPRSTTLVDPTDPSAGTAADYNNNFGTFPWAAASPFGYNGRYIYTRLSVALPH
jgi:iron complex outermembrane receptor protein